MEPSWAHCLDWNYPKHLLQDFGSGHVRGEEADERYPIIARVANLGQRGQSILVHSRILGAYSHLRMFARAA